MPYAKRYFRDNDLFCLGQKIKALPGPYESRKWLTNGLVFVVVFPRKDKDQKSG